MALSEVFMESHHHYRVNTDISSMVVGVYLDLGEPIVVVKEVTKVWIKPQRRGGLSEILENVVVGLGLKSRCGFWPAILPVYNSPWAPFIIEVVGKNVERHALAKD